MITNTITDSRGRTVHVVTKRTGETWYCQDGGSMVNLTYEDVVEGTDIEKICDIDCLSLDEPVYSPEGFSNEF